MNKYVLYFPNDRQKSVGTTPISFGSDKNNTIQLANIAPHHSMISLRDGDLILQLVDSAAKCWINDKEITDANGLVKLSVNDKVSIRDRKKNSFTVEKYDEKRKRKSLHPTELLNLQTPVKSSENPPKYSENLSEPQPAQPQKKEENPAKGIKTNLKYELSSEEEKIITVKKVIKKQSPETSSSSSKGKKPKSKVLPKKEKKVTAPAEGKKKEEKKKRRKKFWTGRNGRSIRRIGEKTPKKLNYAF
jgi:hypothetical protein